MPGDGRPPRPAAVGGQAVIEGVMMRGESSWSVALRAPGGGIVVRRFCLPAAGHSRIARLPVVRGLAALAGGLRIGMRALALSAEEQAPPERPGGSPPRGDGVVLGWALVLATALFLVAPAAAVRLAGQGVLAEAVLRPALFVAYLALLGRRGAMRRLFGYHGAEHKAVACHEAGLPLTPAAAAACPRLHPRCGTTFAALVLLLAGVLVIPLGDPGWATLVASRVLVLPVAAGLAFEIVRWAVRTHAERLLSPLVALQRLTTREPDPEQLAVALAALAAVLGTADAPVPAAGLEAAA